MEASKSKNIENKKVASLYVGDLSPKTLESDLFRIFSTVGSVSNIKLVRRVEDIGNPYASNCYAYVNFEKLEDAKKAVDELNFFLLHGKEMRVMFYDKNKIKEKKGGNVIVKNLPPDTDNQTLHDTFSLFGEILNCKVATNDEGKSKGFGFVQYKNKTSAKKAVIYGSGTFMKENKLKIEKYVSPVERKSQSIETELQFTNVYVKNFPPSVKEEELKEILERFGEITSFYFPTREDGSTKGFAFANFKNQDSALKAIEELHGKYVFEGQKENEDFYVEPFYIQKAQSKQQREEELRNAINKMNIEGQNYKRNLYVTNIPRNYEQKDILEVFKKYGNVVSISLKQDTNPAVPLNFAFVCYDTAESASVALEKANEIYLDGTKLQVSYFKNKQERIHSKESTPESPMAYQTGIPFFYQGMNNYGRPPSVFSNTENSYNNKLNSYKKNFDKRQMGGDLYGLVLSMAPSFQSAWKRLGIRNEVEFAQKITNLLLERPNNEVRNMIGLGNVLSQNITETLNDIAEEESKK